MAKSGRKPVYTDSVFCKKCGTYTRVIPGRQDPKKRICPRCNPDKVPVKKTIRDYIDKTGMPCKDRGKCRPERCIKALECEEMKRP